MLFNQKKLPLIMGKTSLILLFFFSISLIFPHSSVRAANIYYVGPSGSDSNSGTQNQPFKTFKHAVSVLKPGDTLQVASGVYSEKLVVNKSGTQSAPIVINSVNLHGAIIDGGSRSGDLVLLTGAYVQVEGFEVRNSSDMCVNMPGDNTTVKNLKVHDCYGFGIFADADGNTIDGNEVYLTNIGNRARTLSSGWGSAVKIRVGGRNSVIKNNLIYENWGEGIAVTRGVGAKVVNNTLYDNYSVNLYIDNSNGVVVEQNFSYCTGNEQFSRRGDLPAGIALGEEFYDGWGAQLRDVTIKNNISVFCRNGFASFRSNVSGRLNSIRILNNTFWGSSESAISIEPNVAQSQNVVIANNLIEQKDGQFIVSEMTSGVSIGNNVNVTRNDNVFARSPLLDDPFSYRLIANSSAQNKGKVFPEVGTDYSGGVRQASDGAVDAGAFEFSTTQGNTPNQTPSTTSVPVLKQCISDLTSDKVVNDADRAIFLDNFFDPGVGSDAKADLNKDGIIDISDYAIFADEYGKTCQNTATTAPTKRPTSSPTVLPTQSSQPQVTTQPGSGVVGKVLYPNGFITQKIPSNAVYTLEPRIGTFRQSWEEWSMPIYRIGASDNVPLVTIQNTYSGRTEHWPIPRSARPAPEADAHMGVMDLKNNVMYEFWEFAWSGDSIRAGGMKSFPLNGNGISNPTNQRVTAAGLAVTAGMVVREDFIDSNGKVNTNASINHALAMAIPIRITKPTGFVAPAVGDEQKGTGDIPMGARFALPRNANIDNLSVHPLTKIILRAAKDYGIYINDCNSAPDYKGKAIGTIRIEPGLTKEFWNVENNDFVSIIEREVFAVVEQYGLYRITGVSY